MIVDVCPSAFNKSQIMKIGDPKSLSSYFTDNERKESKSIISDATVPQTLAGFAMLPQRRLSAQRDSTVATGLLRQRSSSLPSHMEKSSSASAPATLARTEGPGIARSLDEQFGTAMPPNPNGETSGVYSSERNWRDPKSALVHPQRIVFSPNTPPSPAQIAQLATLLETVKTGAVIKWIISRNGSLVVGPTIVDGVKLGHPTLIGGMPDPEGRIGGEVRSDDLPTGGGDPVLYMNNNSWRYSKYSNRKREHLKNASGLFAKLGFPLQDRWIDFDLVLSR
jgi:hypothetical protein